MNQLALIGPSETGLGTDAPEQAQTPFREFFAVNISQQEHAPRLRAGYVGILAWCECACVASVVDVPPLHVAAYIEQLSKERSAPTVKQRLAAIRNLFDWLVTGQIIPVNPAASVRGPALGVKRVKTPVLAP
jgi:site-specific recombinase XerC